MDLRHEVLSLLQDCGYRVKEFAENLHLIYFEDESLIGFVSIEPDCDQLLNSWEAKQDAFLQSNAQKLKSAAFKAWNAYSVLVTDAPCNKDQASQLRLVEEDFRGSRKIAVASILTRDDLRRALYPLLPIQNLLALRNADPTDLLRSRLRLPESQKDAFLSDASAEEFVKQLLDEELT